MIGIVSLLSVGYASFSQNFLVSGKGTIAESAITIDQLKEKKVTEGDGLYEDIYESGRYIYKGENPNNYIHFNEEEKPWRILSVEADGSLKIIRNESIGNMAYDLPGTRESSSNTYCVNPKTVGCNAWASTNNLVGTPADFTLHYPNGNPVTDTTKYSGTVTQDSSLNMYLNNDYYNNKDGNGITEKARNQIINHDFNVGTPGRKTDEEGIATDIKQEALYKWNGFVGLMSVTEILRTTTDTTCTSISVGHNNSSKSVCSNNNWMWNKFGNYEWTISAYVSSDCRYVWNLYKNGYISTGDALYTITVTRPVLYLRSDIKLSGKGTENNPYIIN